MERDYSDIDIDVDSYIDNKHKEKYQSSKLSEANNTINNNYNFLHGLNLKVKILNSKLGTTWPLPAYATNGSAGLDLRACIEQSLSLAPGKVELIPTGLAVYIADPGYAGIILPRSGLGHKHGIILGNSVGLIDSDYQGELLISCWNRSNEVFTLQAGERIAQLVLVKIAQAILEITNDFDTTQRFQGGFGHTGRL